MHGDEDLLPSPPVPVRQSSRRGSGRNNERTDTPDSAASLLPSPYLPSRASNAHVTDLRSAVLTSPVQLVGSQCATREMNDSTADDSSWVPESFSSPVGSHPSICSPPPMTVPPARSYSGGRGRYKRTSETKRRPKWVEHVQRHMELVNSGALLALDNCSWCKCPFDGNCHRVVGTIAVAERCAMESFGEGAVFGKWNDITPNHEAVHHWFQMVYNSRVVDRVSGRVTSIAYKVDGKEVCRGMWASFHGILKSTLNKIHVKVLKGEDRWSTGCHKEASSSHRMLSATLTRAAAAWWYIRLGYYEILVSHGKIQHPRGICWLTVYEDEFIPEMRLLGHNWAAPGKYVRKRVRMVEEGSDEVDGSTGQEEVEDFRGTISTWYRGRLQALKDLSHDHLGPDQEPFKLVSRANHSAYVRLHTSLVTWW